MKNKLNKSFWKGFYSFFNLEYVPKYKPKSEKETLKEVNKSMERYFKAVGGYMRSAMKQMDKTINDKKQ